VPEQRSPDPGPADPALRTDERRALGLLADGRWLVATEYPDGRRRAWVQLSPYPGDAIPVGHDVLARLLEAGYLRPAGRAVAGQRRFHLTPAGAALAATPTRPEAAPCPTARPAPTRVLVVDDDEAIRAALTGILQDEGYLVETAADGAAALAAVVRARPSAILLDMHMPVLDGRDFSRALRGLGIRVPIVVMTAARDVHASCAEVEGDACISKPFALDAVVDAVARVCLT
jgi:CheY-like chemotaxis protein